MTNDFEASRAGKDVGDPSRWIVFQVENSVFGGPKPETERSRAEVLAGYAANYKKLGIKNAPIQLALESIDARLPKELNLQLDRQPQTVIGPDELAIYLAGLATKTEAGGKPIKTASVSGFTLIQSYRISVNAYRNDADETMVQAMLDEVKKMLFAVDQLSTAD